MEKCRLGSVEMEDQQNRAKIMAGCKDCEETMSENLSHGCLRVQRKMCLCQRGGGHHLSHGVKHHLP